MILLLQELIMTPSLKRDTWQQHIESWQQSQLSKTDYCQQHGLNRACFYKWYSKLCINASPEQPNPHSSSIPLTLIPLTRPQAQNADTHISLHSPQGWRIDCPLHLNSDTLHTLGQLVSIVP